MIQKNLETYFSVEEAIARLSISPARFEEIGKNGRIKKYRMGLIHGFKQSEIDSLTWSDLMGPIRDDEGMMFDFEIR